MSSEKKITDKIVADAVAEKARILEEAKKQADSVINRAKEQAAKFWKMKTFSLMQKQKKQGIKKYQEQKCRQKK